MAQGEQKKDVTKNVTIITANQNYYTRSVVGKVVDFVGTLFIAIVILLGVAIVDTLVVTVVLSTQDNPMPALIIAAVISVPIICVAIATPIRCFKMHKEEIEELHQQYTDTEAIILKEYLEKK